jgi:hypothetical protein
MIPTMIVFGLVAGRWWKTSLVAGTISWPTLLLVQDILHAPREVLGAAALGLVNTLAGVTVHQLALRLIRATRKRPPTPGAQRP